MLFMFMYISKVLLFTNENRMMKKASKYLLLFFSVRLLHSTLCIYYMLHRRRNETNSSYKILYFYSIESIYVIELAMCVAPLRNCINSKPYACSHTISEINSQKNATLPHEKNAISININARLSSVC